MNRNYTVLDGAMGTQLAMRLGPGTDAQEAALCNPDVIVQIHREYIEAGAQIVYTATCDTNRFNTGRYPIEETMPAAVRLAKEAGRDKGIPVALDIGSTGKLIGPYGDISRNRAYEAFAELVRAGRGADIIAVETIFDLKELRVAVLAAMEHSDLPVYGTMTFTDAGRSITGCTLQCFALTAQSLGVQALGLNCSVGPAGMNNMIGVLAGWTDLPIICKPNAGMPDPETKKFNVGAKEFADLCARAAESGATLLGGCCGTDPGCIAELSERLRSTRFGRPRAADTSRLICSDSRAADAGAGEFTRAFSSAAAAEALRRRDYAALAETAVSLEGDALIFDIDLLDSPEEAETLIEEIQCIVNTPAIFASEDESMLSSALRAYTGRAGVMTSAGSASGAVRKYGAVII